MKKTVVCVFAHPDDESFGPSGTIHKLTKDYDVYILCATKGQAGLDSRLKADSKLTTQRARELRASAKLLGVKRVHFLGFRDGTLSNNLYHKIAEKVAVHLKRLKPEIVMTYEPLGVSGHIDHITVALSTSFVVQKLKFVKELWYYCLIQDHKRLRKNYFVYFPSGYKRSDVDKTIEVRSVWDIKVASMKQHVSQKHDARRILKDSKKFPKEEHFIVRKIS